MKENKEKTYQDGWNAATEYYTNLFAQMMLDVIDRQMKEITTSKTLDSIYHTPYYPIEYGKIIAYKNMQEVIFSLLNDKDEDDD